MDAVVHRVVHHFFSSLCGKPRVAHKACPVRAPHIKYGMNIFLTDTDLQGLAMLAEARGKKTKKKQVGGKTGPTVGVRGMVLDG